MSEQRVIKHEDFTEDSDVHKSIDSTQHEQHREISTEDSLDSQFPVLSSIINIQEMENESHTDIHRETENKNESSFDLSTIKQEPNSSDELDGIIATDSVSSSVSFNVNMELINILRIFIYRKP